MVKKVRSAKGEVVDFDYLKIKEQLSSTTPPIDVQKRQDFIENRLLRRKNKKTTAKVNEVLVDAELPSTEEGEISHIESEQVDVSGEKPIKQKARRRKKTDTTEE